MSLITVGLTFTQKSARVYLVCETANKGLRTFSWRLSGRVVAVSGREERERAVELYFTTSMSTKQVVEHLGYPTRQFGVVTKCWTPPAQGVQHFVTTPNPRKTLETDRNRVVYKSSSTSRLTIKAEQ